MRNKEKRGEKALETQSNASNDGPHAIDIASKKKAINRTRIKVEKDECK